MLTKDHVYDETHIKNNNIVKYYYNLKQLLYISLYLKM